MKKLIVAILCCSVRIALAQGAAPPAGPQGARPAPPPPANLKVLPKDISRAELTTIMRGFNAGLGVECAFCHAQNAETHRIDFASDVNPHKDQARAMLTMTGEINQKYLANFGGEQSKDRAKIGCGNCHLGHEIPPPFTPEPRATPSAPAPASSPAPPGAAL